MIRIKITISQTATLLKEEIVMRLIIPLFASAFLRRSVIAQQHDLVGRIAFGSCNSPRNTPLEDGMWATLTEKHPDKLLLLGDNIYTDTKGYLYGRVAAPATYIREQYDALFNGRGWKRLLKNIGGLSNVIATYDDHDYGIDNGDSTYPNRDASMKLFFEYFRPDMQRTRHDDGVYSSSSFVLGGLLIKVILLDSRFNKSPYTAGLNGDFLGESQWSWLADELADTSPDVILLGSSIQILADDKIVEENWGRFPESRSRLLKLVLNSPIKNIFLLSGDVHYAEYTEVNIF